ncbi:MAG: hypothetical protein ACI957_002751 [Verrucomicrobiales bacterium]|jgi:hypothetical protein
MNPKPSSLCKLQTANCKLQTANCKLQTANCKLQTANCKLQTANSKLQTASCVSCGFTADHVDRRAHDGFARDVVDVALKERDKRLDRICPSRPIVVSPFQGFEIRSPFQG